MKKINVEILRDILYEGALATGRIRGNGRHVDGKVVGFVTNPKDNSELALLESKSGVIRQVYLGDILSVNDMPVDDFIRATRAHPETESLPGYGSW